MGRCKSIAPFSFDAHLRFAQLAFIFVSLLLCRHGAEESRGFSGFFFGTFSEKWSYLPTPRQRLPGMRKILPGAGARRKISPDTIFLTRAKSMFNRKLLAVGTTLANSCSGKTPKEQCSRPERRDQHVL
jgi:hypothetical protein